jgi:hypothetical protein
VYLGEKKELSFVCLRLRDECTDHEIETMADTGLPVKFGTIYQG